MNTLDNQVESRYDSRVNRVREKREGIKMAKAMQAKYAGKCAACGRRFPAGAWIVFDGQARHAVQGECGLEANRTSAARYTAAFNRQHAESDRAAKAPAVLSEREQAVLDELVRRAQAGEPLR